MILLLNILLAFLVNFFDKFASSEFAFMGREPTAINPTLYDSKTDSIIQLDDMTFNDTVFCQHSSLSLSLSSAGYDNICTAYVVEFYLDWCGHCRTYARTYKSLARDIHGWNKMVQLAVVNCADPLNEITCQTNSALFFPYIKYFPQNSSNPNNAIPIETLQSVRGMRDLITEMILLDYSVNRPSNWPNFDFLRNFEKYNELWSDLDKSVQLLVIVFEEKVESLTGAQLILDMIKYNNRLTVRRCLKNHSLVDALYIKNFPSMAIFKREQMKPLFVAELRRLFFNELESFLINEESKNEIIQNVVQNQSLCEKDIVKYRQRYFVSEADMLKAMRYALFDEVTRSGKYLTGNNLTAIRDFYDVLAKNFPTKTIYYNITDENKQLSKSKRAVHLFEKMRNYLDQKGMKDVIPIKEYKKKFINLEAENNDPFPVEIDWEHCAGSSPKFRGYSCGLWTTFHALTVQAYKNGLNDSKFVPITPLVAIRNWVNNFFGCQHCREHFLRMTTQTFRMESQVHQPEDTFMYLWQVHNIVNARLRGQDTEDPEFPKRQFPPDFLCSTCRHEGYFNNEQVKDFLLIYYNAIRPFLGRK
uniref:Sulfhydryl oxidase n=1 Tax=Wuchereria bancrofti TaxID=6293 RepID=A0AAF5Q476_WUCBA